MRLDHVSYVASHDQISDVVQRIGSQLGVTFVDGGIHPRFGTRNFTAALLNDQYIEVVCPLDHPATESTPFGQAVTRKAAEGGGWLTWVFSTDSLTEIEKTVGRTALSAHRVRPDGSELSWQQIGVKELLNDSRLPFFIKWESSQHPSEGGRTSTSISQVILSGSSKPNDWPNYGDELERWILWSGDQTEEKEIVSVVFNTVNGRKVLD